MSDMKFIKKFVEMVHSNTPMRGYKKALGLDAAGFHKHMEKLEEYEEMVRLDKSQEFSVTPELLEKLSECPQPPDDEYGEEDTTKELLAKLANDSLEEECSTCDEEPCDEKSCEEQSCEEMEPDSSLEKAPETAYDEDEDL